VRRRAGGTKLSNSERRAALGNGPPVAPAFLANRDGGPNHVVAYSDGRRWSSARNWSLPHRGRSPDRFTLIGSAPIPQGSASLPALRTASPTCRGVPGLPARRKHTVPSEVAPGRAVRLEREQQAVCPPGEGDRPYPGPGPGKAPATHSSRSAATRWPPAAVGSMMGRRESAARGCNSTTSDRPRTAPHGLSRS